jgi:phosphate transport system substrate-binding protein
MNHNLLRSRLLLPVLLVGTLLVTGCSRGNKAAITLAGSTSVEPFAERLSELYMRAHPDAKISVQGGGSSAGIRAVTSRICAIGMSSRELNPEEKGLVEIPIALDAIAIIVNRQNPVRTLTMEQARAIFSGRIRNWQQVGGRNHRITPITREEGSGTRASFEEKVMSFGMPKDKSGKTIPAAFAADALVQDSNGAVREVVADDPDAIGYISSGLIDGRVAAILLGGIEPTETTIRSGRYPIAREFLFLTNGEASGTAQAFINYVLSDSGQNALVEEGLTRIK